MDSLVELGAVAPAAEVDVKGGGRIHGSGGVDAEAPVNGFGHAADFVNDIGFNIEVGSDFGYGLSNELLMLLAGLENFGELRGVIGGELDGFGEVAVSGSKKL